MTAIEADSTIRAWARDNKVAVGARGKLSENVRSRYYAAQKEARRIERLAKKAAKAG